MRLPVYCWKIALNSVLQRGYVKEIKSNGPQGARHPFQSDEAMALYFLFTATP
jgi:hypothetical protein